MELTILQKNDRIIVKNMVDFEISHIFDCGQCFRWDKETDDSYTGVAFGRVLNVKKEGNDVILNNTNLDDFHNIWTSYFDFKTDYTSIKNHLKGEDEVMKQAVEYGHGIRILRQEFWETLISFIISANNNIPRIKKIIQLISERYGQPLGEYKGKLYYAFPTPEALSSLSKDELISCNTGYRAGYIINSAAQFLEESFDVQLLNQWEGEQCHKRLLEFSGVGPKVANCIAFFSLAKLEAFPVDVWIKRLMEYFYFKEPTTAKDIEKYAREKFGQYAGYAQQYLFYYGRELELGKGDH